VRRALFSISKLKILYCPQLTTINTAVEWTRWSIHGTASNFIATMCHRLYNVRQYQYFPCTFWEEAMGSQKVQSCMYWLSKV